MMPQHHGLFHVSDINSNKVDCYLVLLLAFSKDTYSFCNVALKRKAKKTANANLSLLKSKDDDEDEEDEFGMMVRSTVPCPKDFVPAQTTENATDLGHINNDDKIKEFEQGVLASMSEDSIDNSPEAKPETKDKVWKRTTLPLPEQDASVFVKSRKTLKEEIIHNKNLLHKMSMRLFDDRTFIVNDNRVGYFIEEEHILNNAIGTHKHKNPMVTKMAEYMAPMLEMLKVGLSVWRSVFNLFTWRDPFLSFLFLLGAVCLLCVLIVFPWRLFFFVTGTGIVGPQVSCCV